MAHASSLVADTGQHAEGRGGRWTCITSREEYLSATKLFGLEHLLGGTTCLTLLV